MAIWRAMGLMGLLAVTLIGATARAQPAAEGARAPAPPPSEATTNKVEALYAEGAALYRADKFRAAIDRFERAYALYPEPNLLYNMGRCREAMGEVKAATTLYERFIAAKGAAAHVKVKARARLKVLRAAEDRSAKERSAPPPPAAAAATSMAPAVSGSASPAAQGSSAITVTKWVMGGLAVAAAAGGTAAYLLGAADHSQVDDAVAEAQGGIVQMTRAEALELSDSGDTKQIAGYALWGAAAAALVTSAILFAVDGGSGEQRPEAPAVTLTPGVGGVLLSGRF